jgi:hypothetical protein
MGKDDKGILEVIDKSERESKFLRYGHERDWYRNLLFKQGHHWIVWDATGRRFRDKVTKPWIPKPVTNKFAATMDTIVSMVLRIEPPLQWSPADLNDETQRTVSETATKVLDLMKEQSKIRLLRQSVAQWFTYTGNSFLINLYDQKGGSPINVPYILCSVCGTEALPSEFEQGCPTCQNTVNNNYAVDEMGMPKEESFQGGAVRTELATPFEIYGDYRVPWYEATEFTRLKQRPLDYFQKQYGKKVEADSSSTLSEFYSGTLPYMASSAGATALGAVGNQKEAATEKMYCRLPDDEYPNGLYVVAAGQKILEKSDLPYKDLQNKPFLPLVHFNFDPIPGSAMGKTVGNDLALKQKQRNEVESLIQLTVMRMANPVWILPYGVDVEGFSGQPGAVLKVYQLSQTNSNRPERLPGENVPSSVMQWLEKIDNDFDDVSSVYDTLKGGAAPGVTAGYAIQLLTERGQSRWGPLFQRWENGWVQWAEQVTAMTREYMPSDQIRQMLGENGDWEIQSFKSTDLGQFKIKVEQGSIKPRSELTEQAQVDNLIAKGLIDLTNPAVKAEVLRSIGMSKYDQHSDIDMKDSAREEDGFYRIATQLPLVPETIQGSVRFRELIDNHQVHIYSHKQFAKGDRFLKLPAEWQEAWYAHIQQHGMRLQQEAMMMMGPPPGAPGSEGPPGQGGPPESGPPENLAASDKGGHIQNPAATGGMPS